jgi:hypothetical protein
MKRKVGKKQYKKKKYQPTEFYSRYKGRLNSRSDFGQIPTKLAIKLPTLSGDKMLWEGNPYGGHYTKKQWTNFLDNIQKHGIRNRILIQKAYGKILVSNGNHRRFAAKYLGLKSIPAKIEYGMEPTMRQLLYHPRLKPFGTPTKLKRKL